MDTLIDQDGFYQKKGLKQNQYIPNVVSIPCVVVTVVAVVVVGMLVITQTFHVGFLSSLLFKIKNTDVHLGDRLTNGKSFIQFATAAYSKEMQKIYVNYTMLHTESL